MSKKAHLTIRYSTLVLTGSIATMVALQGAWAADQAYESTNPSNVWDSSTQNWDASAAAWTNGNNAIFSGTGESVSVNSAITVGDITFNVAGYTLANGTGGLTLANATNTFTVAGAGIGAVIAETIAGTGRALTKTGLGTLTLSSGNSYTGGTNIDAGILAIGNANALGTAGTISFGGGTLQYLVSTDLSARFSTAAGQQYRVDTNGQTITWASALTSSGGSLFKTGTGTLILTSTGNTYDGGTTVTAGTLQGNDVTAYAGTSTTVTTRPFGTGLMTLGGGQLNLRIGAGSDTAAQTLTLGNSVLVTADTILDFSRNTGTITNKTLAFNDLSIGSAGKLTVNGTTGTGYVTSFSSVTLTGNATIAGNAAGTLTLGAIAESGGSYSLTINKAALGTVTFTTASSYTGGTSLSLVNAIISDKAAFGTGAITIANSSTIQATTSLTGANRLANSISLSGTAILTVGGSSDLEFGGAVTGIAGQSLAVTNTGVTTLASGTANTMGKVTMSAGILNISGATTLGLSSATLIDGTGGTINGTGGGKILLNAAAGDIGTTGNLVINAIIANGTATTVDFTGGSGTVVLTGANTWTGATTIQGLTVSVTSIGSVGSSSSNLGAPLDTASAQITMGTTNSTTSTLKYTGVGETTDRVISLPNSTGSVVLDQSGATGLLKFTGGISSLGGNRTLFLQGSGIGEISGNITKTASNLSLVKAGAGTWTLSGTNSFGGGATVSINGGVLVLGSSGALGTGTLSSFPIISFGGGTLQFSANNTVDYSSRFSGATQNFKIDTNGQNVTFASPIIGAANASTFTKLGTGKLTLSSATSHYTGATTISGGILSVTTLANGGSDSSIGTSTAAESSLVFDGGTLQYTGGTATSDRAFTINAGKTATIDVTLGTTNLTLAGATGAATNGSLVKTGTGKLTLTGASTYTGPTDVTQGALALGASGSISGDINVANGATFDTTAQTGYSVATGRTINNNGHLNLGLGKTLDLNGTLRGSGFVTGSVSANGSTATLAPGNSAGLLAITDNLSIGGGAHLDIELGKTVSGSGQQPFGGTDYDQVYVSGGTSMVTLTGGDLRLTLLTGGAGIQAGDIFYLIINGSVSGATVGSFATFSGAGVVNNGDGTINVGGQQFVLSYTANFEGSSFASLTGNDVALLAIPEPSAFVTLVSALGCLLGLQRFRRRRLENLSL